MHLCLIAHLLGPHLSGEWHVRHYLTYCFDGGHLRERSAGEPCRYRSENLRLFATGTTDNMKEKQTVSSYFVKALLFRFHNQPDRAAQLLQDSGFAARSIEELGERVSPKPLAHLWLAVIRDLNDEFFGFDAHGMPMGSFALICRALIQAPTVGSALRRSLEYFGLFLRDIRCEVQIRGDRVVVVMRCQAHDEYLKAVMTETFLLMIVGLMCWLAGRRIPISHAQFEYGQPDHGDAILLWGSRVDFNARTTEIEFECRHLELPVTQDRQALYAFLRNAPQSVFLRFRNREGYSARIHQRLMACGYEEWPTLEQVAGEFNVNLARLRRSLRREGFTYQELKDEARRLISFELLQTTSNSIAEVAHKVGFAEASAFHRAFKQWTGESPGSFRLRCASSGGNR